MATKLQRKSTKFVGEWFAVLFFVAIIYVLVRPRSAGAETVKLFSEAMVALVRAATDI